MRIALVTHHRLAQTAGAAGVTLDLANEYSRLGHEVSIVSYEDLPDWLGGRFRTLIFPLFVALRLRRQIARAEVDVVDFASSDGWILSLLTRGTPAVSVFRSHGLEHVVHHSILRASERDAFRSWKYSLFWGGINLWLVAQAARHADGCIFLNATELRYSHQILKVRSESTRLIPNGIDMGFLAAAIGISRSNRVGDFRMVFAGSYIPVKGTYTLSVAVRSLFRQHPNLRLRLIGTSVTKSEIMKDYELSDSDRIEVVPSFERSELAKLLLDCDVLVLPSQAEGFGKVLVEAMACGVIPIASRVSGPREVLASGRYGILFNPGDSEALVVAIKGVMSDPKWAEGLRESGMRRAQYYTVSRQAADCILFYSQLLAQKGVVCPTSRDLCGNRTPAAARGSSTRQARRATV